MRERMKNYNFGKIEGGILSFAPRELLKEGGFNILTNSAEEYARFGYLPVIRTEGGGEPEEKDGAIYVYEQPETDEISGEEFLAAFEQALEV